MALFTEMTFSQRGGGPATVRRTGLRSFLALLLAVTGAARIVAGEGIVNEPPPPEVDSRGELSHRVLLLKNGRIVEGRISRNSGGYVVEVASGSMLVPFSQVRLTARNRQDAYFRLRASIRRPTAAHHVALARWCLTCGLYNHCREELRAALRLEPDNRDAANTLIRLEKVLNPTGPDEDRANDQPAKTDDGFAAPQAQSLAGLTRETARQYVARIQPILMNNCATAGCHNRTAENSFRLHRVRIGPGSRRYLTEANLAVVLRYVDPVDPGRSRLLSVLADDDVKHSRAVFRSPAGRSQMQELREWIHSLPANSSSTPDTGPGSSDGPTIVLGSELRQRAAERLRHGAQGRKSGGYQPTPAMRALRQRKQQTDVLQKVLEDRRPDAFDPAEFNRRHHDRIEDFPPSSTSTRRPPG